MGPELSFGWTVGDALKEDESDTPNILIITRSLTVDYRPPSSGGKTGLYYGAMLTNVYKTLAKLSKLVPGYTSDRGYELVEFA